MFIPIDKNYSQPCSEKLLFVENNSGHTDSWLPKMLRKSDSWWSSPKQGVYANPSKAQGTLQKKRKEALKKLYNILSITQPLQSWTHSSCGYFPWSCKTLALSTITLGWGRAHQILLLPSELLMIEYEEGRITVFSYIPTVKPVRLQWTALNMWSHRQPKNLAGTKQYKKTGMWERGLQRGRRGIQRWEGDFKKKMVVWE